MLRGNCLWQHLAFVPLVLINFYLNKITNIMKVLDLDPVECSDEYMNRIKTLIFIEF